MGSIGGVNVDLTSRIGGGARKSVPSTKLEKASAGESGPDSGLFAEQLGLADRSSAPRPPINEEDSETAAPSVARDHSEKRGAVAPARDEGEESVATSSTNRTHLPRSKREAAVAREPSTDGRQVPVESAIESLFASQPELKPVPADESFDSQPSLAEVESRPANQTAFGAMMGVGADGKGGDPLAVSRQTSSEPGQVRRQVMQDFMSQMKREFGIPPEEIAHAFASMDEKTLVRPPEESTKAFLANLDVPPTQESRVAELYNTMIRSTGEAALNEKLAGTESGVRLSVLSPREEALRKLNESIDQLNSAFAMRGQARITSMAAPLDTPQKAQLALEQMNLELARMENTARSKDPSPANRSEAGDSDDRRDAGALGFESLLGESVSAIAAGGALSSQTASGGGDEMSGGREFDLSEENGPVETSMTEMNAPGPVVREGSNFAEAVKGAGKAKKAATESIMKAEAGAAGADVIPASAETQSSPLAKTAVAGPAGMMIERPTPTQQDEQANVKELIRQAQLAIKKGGGEIKMDLKPEGIGRLHLKVSVENGQVNVQMLTENDASKRLLEKGLHELKSNLAAQELKVDNMKVDVGQELKKHMDNAGEHAREQARQFAADVMSQFRDERQGFRQGFMENQGWRQYPRSFGQPEMGRGGSASAEATQVARDGANARARRASAGRLDLVA